jgi:hypothetical protein
VVVGARGLMGFQLPEMTGGIPRVSLQLKDVFIGASLDSLDINQMCFFDSFIFIQPDDINDISEI